MPGFTSKTTSLTVFHVNDPGAVTPEKLKEHAFRDVAADEETSEGWTNIDDMLDMAWEKSAPEKGDWTCFALRVDKRRVPSAVLSKCYREAVAQALEGSGKKRMGKGRAKELKQEVKDRLLAKMEAAPSVMEAAMTRSGKLFAAGTSATMLKTFAEHMSRSFGVALAPYEAGVDTQAVLQDIYNKGTSVTVGGHTYSLADAGRTTLSASDGTVKKRVDALNDRSSVDAGLAQELSVAGLAVNMTGDNLECAFDLNDKLVFSKVKAPAVDKKSDPDEALLERLFFFERIVDVVHTLFVARPGENS
jgi:DNA recombination-dependent growth factor C